MGNIVICWIPCICYLINLILKIKDKNWKVLTFILLILQHQEVKKIKIQYYSVIVISWHLYKSKFTHHIQMCLLHFATVWFCNLSHSPKNEYNKNAFNILIIKNNETFYTLNLHLEKLWVWYTEIFPKF